MDGENILKIEVEINKDNFEEMIQEVCNKMQSDSRGYYNGKEIARELCDASFDEDYTNSKGVKAVRTVIRLYDVLDILENWGIDIPIIVRSKEEE